MLVIPHSGYLDDRVINCTAVTLAVDRVYIDDSNYYCFTLDTLRVVCADAGIGEFCRISSNCAIHNSGTEEEGTETVWTEGTFSYCS